MWEGSPDTGKHGVFSLQDSASSPSSKNSAEGALFDFLERQTKHRYMTQLEFYNPLGVAQSLQ